MSSKLIGYWVATVIIAFIMTSGGAWHLSASPDNVAVFTKHLGYPVYFMQLLGAWKFLGGVAIVVPRFPRLKEWAYAGIFFELTGGAISRIALHDGAAHILAPFGFALLTLVSWALRPTSRMLGTILPSKA